jgi:hypothetical protein
MGHDIGTSVLRNAGFFAPFSLLRNFAISIVISQ